MSTFGRGITLLKCWHVLQQQQKKYPVKCDSPRLFENHKFKRINHFFKEHITLIILIPFEFVRLTNNNATVFYKSKQNMDDLHGACVVQIWIPYKSCVFKKKIKKIKVNRFCCKWNNSDNCLSFSYIEQLRLSKGFLFFQNPLS